MTQRSTITKVATLFVGFALLTATFGCDRQLRLTNAASAVAGWLLGSVFTLQNVEHLCYRNGELIDCADLPADLAQ